MIVALAILCGLLLAALVWTVWHNGQQQAKRDATWEQTMVTLIDQTGNNSTVLTGELTELVETLILGRPVSPEPSNLPSMNGNQTVLSPLPDPILEDMPPHIKAHMDREMMEDLSTP